MKINPGFFVNKIIRTINRPALRDCTIDKNAKIGTGSNCIRTKIGRYSYMGKNNSVADTNIGSFCSIASYCAIGGGAHPINMVSTSPVFIGGRNVFNINFSHREAALNANVYIGNDVWIGEAVFVNDGITIGDGAIIGAHSVVTHDIPPYAIVAGAPAKILHYRFSDEQIQKLLEIKWWDWPEEKIKKYSKYFDSVDHLVGAINQ